MHVKVSRWTQNMNATQYKTFNMVQLMDQYSDKDQINT